jgi:hypothetical protein
VETAERNGGLLGRSKAIAKIFGVGGGLFSICINSFGVTNIGVSVCKILPDKYTQGIRIENEPDSAIDRVSNPSATLRPFIMR